MIAKIICPCFHTARWLQHTFTALNRLIPVIIMFSLLNDDETDRILLVYPQRALINFKKNMC